jgi:hypothetical protein
MDPLYGKVNILSKEECKSISSTVNSLKEYWIERTIAGQNLHTLGVSAFADGPKNGEAPSNEYLSSVALYNNLLSKNFDFLYNAIINKVSDIYGAAQFLDDSPIPGFFIYGGKDGFTVNNLFKENVNVHIDNSFGRIRHTLSRYSEVDHSNYISLTLSISLPAGGAGMILWDQPDIGIYSNNSYSDYIKQIEFKNKDYNKSFMEDHVSNYTPELVEYSVGDMLHMDSKVVHAISHGIDIEDGDQRITVQAFGIKCDGIWRLTF